MLGKTNASHKFLKTNLQIVNYVMLYDYGKECVDLTGGWGMYNYPTYVNYGVFGEKNDTYIHSGANTSDSNVHKNVYAENLIDVTGYSGFALLVYLHNSNIIAGLINKKPNNNDAIWEPSDKIQMGTVATTGVVSRTDEKVFVNQNINLTGSYYFGYWSSRYSGSSFYSNFYAGLLYKEDDWQTLAGIAGITAGSIDDILTNSSVLLSNEEAVKFMVYNCTGDFMVSAIQSSTFLTALNNSEYKTKIYANEHWSKFLSMVA